MARCVESCGASSPVVCPAVCPPLPHTCICLRAMSLHAGSCRVVSATSRRYACRSRDFGGDGQSLQRVLSADPSPESYITLENWHCLVPWSGCVPGDAHAHAHTHAQVVSNKCITNCAWAMRGVQRPHAHAGAASNSPLERVESTVQCWQCHPEPTAQHDKPRR